MYFVVSSTTCALGGRWAKPPGPKNEKWGCWGAVGPKMGQKPRCNFLSFGRYFFFGIWEVGLVCLSFI